MIDTCLTDDCTRPTVPGRCALRCRPCIRRIGRTGFDLSNSREVDGPTGMTYRGP